MKCVCIMKHFYDQKYTIYSLIFRSEAVSNLKIVNISFQQCSFSCNLFQPNVQFFESLLAIFGYLQDFLLNRSASIKLSLKFFFLTIRRVVRFIHSLITAMELFNNRLVKRFIQRDSLSRVDWEAVRNKLNV